MELERKTKYARGNLWFYVGRDQRWVQFAMMFHLNADTGDGLSGTARVLACDLGYHSPVPMYEGHKPMDGDCDLTDGPCYYDGTSLGAQKPFDILRRDGDDALWTFLEAHWHAVFGTERTAGGFGEMTKALLRVVERRPKNDA